MCLVMTVLMLLSLIISYRVVKAYTRPIRQISSEIKSLSTGNLDKKISVDSDDEIIEKLVEVRYLSVDAVDHVNVDWLDDTMIELTVKENGFPLGRLEKVLN